MERAEERRVPAVVWAYGVLGLVPFVAGAVGAWAMGVALRPVAQVGLLAYGGLILGFLGGARFGMEAMRGQVRGGVVGAAMAGSILATLLVATASVSPPVRLVVLAVAHIGQWAWDTASVRVPPWYRPLRHVLTAGAVVSLLIGAGASPL